MRVGIIGAGIQAKVAHLPAFSKIEGVEIIGIADINEKSAKLLSKKFGIPDVYTDYHDLIGNNNVDLISICTPNHLHKQIAVDCALAGKHTLIEKPMATTVKDADEIVETAKENGVKLCVVQNYRLFPSVKETKKRIRNGRIGEIISMHSYGHLLQSFNRSWILKSRAGVIEDFGPHLIDIILYLNNFDNIKKVYAIGGNFGGHLELIVHAQIMIEFENKSIATIDLSWLSGAKEIAVYVQGTGGLLHTDIRNNHIQEIHHYSTPLDDISSISKKLKRTAKGAISGEYFSGAKTYYTELIENFIEHIENNRKLLITGEECRKTAIIIENAYKSIKENRQISIDKDYFNGKV
jgi:UDP-N-acetylglucosamine 3-dehydrogenase